MTRLELFRRAKQAVAEYRAEFSACHAAESIAKQIDYLIAVESGSEPNRTRLDEIIIGILTVREIEPYEGPLIDLLHQVSHEADLMKRRPS